ncbi:hypothetical protein RRG08_065782 [Elysia crispata]|uniref:Secreted protein n=1 Tax=Elysia crispata TaxID=231223 RepID=A0AAE1DKM0_9GAST|nr:hypothetical protein RRG08_065782 [Elysia crispata]
MTSLFLFAAEVRHCLCMIFLTTYNIQQRQAVQSDHRRSEAGGRPCFCTTPMDSTGGPHIVLCGSEKFPVTL